MLAAAGSQLRALEHLSALYLPSPGEERTLLMCAGFRVVFTRASGAPGRGQSGPEVATSLEVDPQGGARIAQWLMELRDMDIGDMGALAAKTGALFKNYREV